MGAELFHFYYYNVYLRITKHYGMEDNIPRIEAKRNNLLEEYFNFKNERLIKFGCISKELLLNTWCINELEYLDSLDRCGFVLSVYECSDYFELPSQVVYNLESAVLISKESVFELLKNN